MNVKKKEQRKRASKLENNKGRDKRNQQGRMIKGLFTWKWGTGEKWGTSHTRGKETLAFTCNLEGVRLGSKCNHLVAKHAHKQRTIVCSNEAAFCFNVVFAGKSLIWFRWLPWISDSTLKLSPALSISSAFSLRFWRGNRRNNSPRSSDLITPVRQVTPLRRFHIEKTHPTEGGYPDRLTG